MNFSTDADLLVWEPRLFLDVPLEGQERLRVSDGEAVGNVITSVTGGFSALSPADVVVLRSSPADALCRAVASVADDHAVALAIEPYGLAATTGLTVSARTFGPQRSAVHEQLMEAIGLGSEDPSHGLDESAVVSVGLMRRLEVLGTLWRAYDAARSGGGSDEALAAHAGRYRTLFAEALGSARVLIDSDGDGRADLWRLPAAARLMRV